MKVKEKCCADCSYGIKCGDEYACKKTAVRNRINGRYDYKKCEFVIDSTDCEFKDATLFRVIVNVGAFILMTAIIAFIYFAF